MLAFVVLARLARAGPASQRDLALHAAQHPAGMSRLLGALEREGLVERRPDGADRRRRLVAATPAGCDRAAAWRPLVRAAAAEVLSVLEAPEQARLASLLRKLVAGRHG
jgi:DNA-binding MarR family transcriptional regulator